jgi:uncharacterized RDD family membrane protein YckC
MTRPGDSDRDTKESKSDGWWPPVGLTRQWAIRRHLAEHGADATTPQQRIRRAWVLAMLWFGLGTATGWLLHWLASTAGTGSAA